MIILILATMLLQVPSGSSDDDRLKSLTRMMDAAKKSESSSPSDKAIEQYDQLLDKAKDGKLADPRHADEYDGLISAAALHLATLREAKTACADKVAMEKTMSYYGLASGTGAPEQQALARNNLASLYWRCHQADEAKRTMAEIPYSQLKNPRQRSFYLDNYGRLSELSGDWSTAAKQYQAALLNTPADEIALEGMRRFVEQKEPDRILLTLETTDILLQKHYARSAIDLILRTLKSPQELSNGDHCRLMSSLMRGYAFGTTTVAEFETADWRSLEATKSTHPKTAAMVLELHRAFLETFEVGAASAEVCRKRKAVPQEGCAAPASEFFVLSHTLAPVSRWLDRTLSRRTQSVESRAVQCLFPQSVALGAGPSLSSLLTSVADECARTGDFDCAAQKYAAAWVLDTNNNASSRELHGLDDSHKLPQSLERLVRTDVANFYSSRGQGLSAFYREPSQQALPNQALPASSSQKLTIWPPRNEDTVVRGVAPPETEAVYVEVLKNSLTCKRAGELESRHFAAAVGKTASHSATGAQETTSSTHQSALVATDVATGSFTARLQNSLATGDSVCVYTYQDGMLSSSPQEEQVVGIPFADHLRNYLAVGGSLSQVGGAWKLLPRASWNSDLNVARWGYRRYQDQSSQTYPSLTALLNLYAEARATSIPKATLAQPTGTGLTHVTSLEFGGYAPLFTHGTTWWFLNYRRALFIAPLIKAGVDFFPDSGVEDSFAGGVRLGILRLARSTRFNTPDLQSYVDVVYGNNANLLTDPQTNNTIRLRQLNVTGMLKIPETPFYLGFNSTAGPGAKQTGIFAGARVEFSRLFRHEQKEP